MNLKIKTCKQPYGTSICGPCCVKMCAQHFGIQLPLATIEEYCNCTIHGTMETSLTLALNKIGLIGTLYAVPSGGMFFGKYKDMPADKIIRSLKTRAALMKDKFFPIALREAAQLIEQGRVKFELPSRECIERELDSGHPWIMACQYYIFGELKDNRGVDITHFVVVQGYDKKHFIVNDPLSGVNKVDKDKMLCAVFSTSPDEVSAICVSK